ncbi:hypothetical protein Tco_1256911 [Tanacetum coccineum]
MCEVDGSNKDGDGISDGWWVDGGEGRGNGRDGIGSGGEGIYGSRDDNRESREGGGDEGSAAAAAAMSASVAADISV